jgi:hypothetical protein
MAKQQSQELKGSKLVSGSHREAYTLMPNIYNSGVAAMFHGPMGIGKTQFFEAFAKVIAKQKGLEFSEDIKDINSPKKFMFISFIAHQMDMAEVKGLMYPNEDRTKTIVLPLGNLPTSGQGIILFDEINLAPPAIQNNLYQLVQRAQLGFYKVPDGYRCYAAGNRIEDGANVYDMPMPLNNRMVHFDFCVPSVEDWVEDFAVPNDIDHRVIAFLSFDRSNLFKYNPDSNEDVKAFATPRSWKYVSDLIKGVSDSSMVSKLSGLAIGEALGAEFSAFIDLSIEYDIPKIFKTRILEIPTEISMLYSLTSGLVSYYKDGINSQSLKEEAKNQRVEALFEIAMKFKKEYTALILSMAKAADSEVFTRIKKVNHPLYTKITTELAKVFL